jgi:hypothetical protein
MMIDIRIYRIGTSGEETEETNTFLIEDETEAFDVFADLAEQAMERTAYVLPTDEA